MYGTRAAAQSWSKEYTKTLKEFGFVQHLGSPCCFHLPAKQLKVVVHGDDFVSLGPESAIRWYHEQMTTKYEVKVRGIVGPEPRDMKAIRILNRVVSWRPEAIYYEPDQRHVEAIISKLGMMAAKPVVTPGVKTIEEEGDEED